MILIVGMPILILLACSTINNELSEEEVAQLQTHVDEVQAPPAALPTTNQRKWMAPEYEKQENVLGYSKDTFVIPEPLKSRVGFWIDIYTKYTTSQGVLHDSKYTHLVYEPIDLAHIDNDKTLSGRQKFKAEQKYLKERKKIVAEILSKLNNVTDPTTLSGEELRYWKLFEGIEEKNKFKEASQKNRLRFQLGQRDRFIQGIFYSGRYLREMEKIFSSYNLPQELTRLPFVESSFNIKARSKVGASGIWQFMRGTGKEYMKVGAVIDERNDPIISTYAAAKLLKSNYSALQSWPLAVTAYNYGVYGLKRIVEKYQTTELFDLYGKNPTSRFGFATESFYASFLAAIEVEKNAKKYFGKLAWAEEVNYFETKLQRPILFNDLLPFFSGKPEDIINLHPHFSQNITKHKVPIPAKTIVRVPVEQEKLFAEFLADPKKSRLAERDPNTNNTSYVVNTGDTLYDISKQFQVSVDKIMQYNQDLNPRMLKPGQIIEIPQ